MLSTTLEPRLSRTGEEASPVRAESQYTFFGKEENFIPEEIEQSFTAFSSWQASLGQLFNTFTIEVFSLNVETYTQLGRHLGSYAAYLVPQVRFVYKGLPNYYRGVSRRSELSSHAPKQRLRSYLRAVSESGEISEETARLAWKGWTQLWLALPYALPVPDACPGPDGQLLYTWDQDEHHFELEIFPNGSGEFFYRNRTTGKLWGVDYVIGEQVPQEAIDKLKLFL
jgi:hypothetical protein